MMFIGSEAMDDSKVIGARLRTLRGERRQPEIAKALSKIRVARGERAVSVQSVQQWEAGRKKKFSYQELEDFAAVLGCTRDFLATGEGIPPTSAVHTVESVYNDRARTLPLILMQDISNGRLQEAMSRAVASGVMRKTNFSPSGEGFVFRVKDKSMEPVVGFGAFVTVECGLAPEPEDFVVAELPSGVVVFREFLYRGRNIILAPKNTAWREEEFTDEIWEKDVQIHGVMLSFETPWRRAT